MTNPDITGYQLPPPGGGDGDSHSSNEPPPIPIGDAGEPHGDDGPDASETDSHAREKVTESDEPGELEPIGPRDWEPIAATFTEDEILRRLASHATIEGAHNRQGWLHRMEQLPLIRAIYSKMRGTRFEKAVKTATGTGKTQAYGIVTWLYAEPQMCRTFGKL